MIQIPKAIRNPVIGTLSVLACVAMVPDAHAQWTVTSLDPDSIDSRALAASGGQQAGHATVGGVHRASLWSGTAASWVDLHPEGWTDSEARAASGGQQAGYARVGGVLRACLWSGTAASRVDLDPEGSTESIAYAISGGQQAGCARVGGLQRASLWSGTAASWIDLNPAGSTQSIAYASSGGRQAGSARVGGVTRASLWSGTAASWVDLHPEGSAGSIAYAVSGGQEAGFALVGEVAHASLWSGTAASWVDLHPEGSAGSLAYAASGGQQVGLIVIAPYVYRASLWSGSAASWVDLHAFLPAGFISSVAHGISSDGVNTYVVGYGRNTLTRREEALIWTRPLPCTAASIVSHPQAAMSCPSGSATFSITAAGVGALAYQWRHNASPLADSPGHIVGSESANLTIMNTQASDAGLYDCVVTNACGSVISDAATLTVLDPSDPECGGCPCPADFDQSGGTPDGADIDAFFTAWLNGDPEADADCSGGTPDGADIDIFFAAWLNGGC